jgi:hypothetical protein
VSTKAAGNRGKSPLQLAREQEADMDEKVAEVAERARAAGNARPKAKVKTRHVKPETLRRRGAPDFRERGLTKRICQRPACAIEFVPTSPNQRYHDSDCRALHEKERQRPKRPEPRPPTPPRVLPDPAPPGKAETRGKSVEEVGWETVDRYLELLFKLAEDADEDAPVRVTALELLDSFIVPAVAGG